ncbi:MAG: SDR family NAD(P)-dependent oxidoreductase [Candidatus Omnitrophica bacterium]|nr:SDR family NAD(P)-dependent oxidoreductase [Candidatus Omnitrophota bacterium]
MELKSKKVLVTGACGFIGSHLVEELIDQGCNVTAFVFYNAFNSWGWLDSLDERYKKSMKIFAGDVRDPNGVRTAMKDQDFVFHLAALIGIPFSYHSPDSYVDTNVKGTLNVLQAARDLKTKRVLVTSTSEVYGTAQYVPITEQHPRQPQSPYSATKIAADALAESFIRSFDLPVTIVRPFNTFGPRQSLRAVIPIIIGQILSGQKTIHMGSLHPTRDFVYVKDTVKGFVRICSSDKTIGEDINIATNSEISIGDLARSIAVQLKKSVEIVQDDERIRPKESEVERLCGDNEKLRKLTGWVPEISFEVGLKKTIEWFLANEGSIRSKAGIYNI